jgi:hypothetical protein
MRHVINMAICDPTAKRSMSSRTERVSTLQIVYGKRNGISLTIVHWARSVVAPALVMIASITVAIALPPRLDWTPYHGAIEILAGRAMGRSVVINGGIHLVLPPETVRDAEDVAIGAGTKVPGLHLRIST